ncbi:MAG: hypothetical protein KDA24_19305 [Deltaproteobacteria bacterium]|nr:hypothetical protein [Deltaproteobacteria bacterium]
MTQLGAIGAARTPLEERAAIKNRVRELRQLMAVFLKAGKTLRLYSEGHRFFSRFADEFESRLEAQFEHGESLTFEITPTNINWDGHVVFANKEQRQNLAFKLYRDGVRLLQFRKGVTAAETRDFVSLVARESSSAAALGADLSVLFWEADFKNIHLAVAETFVDYDEQSTEALKRLEDDLSMFEEEFGLEKRDVDESDLEELKKLWDGSKGTSGGAAGVGKSSSGAGQDEEEAYRPLAFEDIPRGQELLRGDPQFGEPPLYDDTDIPALPPESLDDAAMEFVYSDLYGLEQAFASFEEVGGVLAQVVEAEPDPEELSQLLKNLDDAMAPLLSTAAIGPLNSILRRIALLARRETEAGSFRAAPLSGFVRGVGKVGRLGVLARAVNEDWNPALKGDLFTFISLQDPSNLDELMGFLALLIPEEPRKVVVDALVLMTERSSQPWLDRLQGANWHMACDAMSALAMLDDIPALGSIVPLFERDEATVRRKVVEVLKDHRTPRVDGLMLKALGDEDGDVRMAGLRYCAVHRLRDAADVISEQLNRRSFKDREFKERRGWYITWGMLGGGDLLPELTAIADSAKESGDASEQTQLTLLAIKSIRETGARVWLQEYAASARGELGRMAKKVLEGKA